MTAAASELLVRPFAETDTESVVALWRDCGLTVPWNDPRADIAIKMTVQPELFLTGLRDGRVVATVMAGFDGHRGWINYLAVATGLRKRGYGRRMVAAAERALRERGCPKLNLQVRTSNRAVLDFYRRIGFVEDDVASLGKRLDGDR